MKKGGIEREGKKLREKQTEKLRESASVGK